MAGPATPGNKFPGLGSSSFARRYLRNLDLISFPLPTKMFQFGRYRLINLCIQLTIIVFLTIGFPHSEISGSKLYSSSPKLIAGLRVLLRLLMPRHPPVALSNLTQKTFLVQDNVFFKRRVFSLKICHSFERL